MPPVNSDGTLLIPLSYLDGFTYGLNLFFFISFIAFNPVPRADCYGEDGSYRIPLPELMGLIYFILCVKSEAVPL